MMNELEKVLTHIRALSHAQCEEVARSTLAECECARSRYAQEEQDEYWRFLGAATKEAEERLIKLGDLAKSEAQKKLFSTRREMVDAAFDLAARKLAALPAGDYRLLLKKLNLKPDFTPESLAHRYKELLLPAVEALLFD